MQDSSKTNQERIVEISVLKQRNKELEQLEAERKRVEQEISLLAMIGRVIGSTLDINKVYERVATEVKKLIPFDSMMVNLIRVDENALSIDYVSGIDIPGRRVGDRIPYERSLAEAVVCGKKGILHQANSTKDIEKIFPYLINIIQAGLISTMSVPIISMDKIIGVLVFRSKKTDIYRALDLSLAQRIADQIAGAIANAQLFFDLKKTEKSLRMSEENYRQLFENSPAAIYQIDVRTGKFLKANDVVCKYLGCSQEEITSLSPYDFMTDESKNILSDRLTKISLGEKVANDPEYEIADKNGKHLWLQLYSKNIFDSGGSLIGFDVVAHDITERKRAEATLRDSESKYQFLTENMADVVFTLDLNLVTTYVSPSIERMLGYTPEERIVQKVDQQLTPKSQKLVFETLATELDREKGKNSDPDRFRTLELEYYHKDGSVKYLITYIRGIRDSERKLTGFYGSHHDITERKTAEQALIESERRLKMVTDNVPALIGYVDNNSRYQFVNKNYEKWFGLKQEAMLGMSTKELLPLKTYERSQPFINRALAGEEVTFEGAVLLPNGDMKIFCNNLVPDRSLNDEIIGYYVLVSDITDRKQAEEALRESKDQYRTLVENATDVVFRTDENGFFTFVNPALLRITGYREEEIIGEHYKMLIRPDMFKEAITFFANQLINKIHNTYTEYPIVTRDGRDLWFGQNLQLLIEGDHVTGFQAVAREITDRKRTEEALRKTLESLRKAVGTTIQVMVSAVEARDPYTSGHQIRSADLARAIATKMRFPLEKIEGIRMASSIHDIGKLSIPAEILSKPTKLSELQFALIKEHAQKGYEILKDVESPWPLAEIVLQHHERMDGSGYPRNLKGDDILMEARILAVADVVEAMASHRPYRPALGLDAALEEIEKNIGTLYDNAVVNACLKLFREKGFQFVGN